MLSKIKITIQDKKKTTSLISINPLKNFPLLQFKLIPDITSPTTGGTLANKKSCAIKLFNNKITVEPKKATIGWSVKLDKNKPNDR